MRGRSGPPKPMPRTAQARTALLTGAISDACKQLANARHSCEKAGGDPDYGERRWRMAYPGLAEIIDYHEGEA